MRSGALLAACVVATVVAIPCNAGVVRQITNETRVTFSGWSLDDAGTWVFASTTANLEGANPENRFHPARWDAASGAGSLLTAFPDGVNVGHFAVSDDGQWMVLVSTSNPLGTNSDRSPEIFLHRTDGGETRQITNLPSGAAGPDAWALSGSANRVVFASRENLTGGNPSNVRQLFVVNADGTGLAQLTSSTIDGVFQISISDDGQRIAFSYTGNPTGGNPDLSPELFTVRHDGTDLRQLTVTGGQFGGILNPMIAGGGSKIVFDSRESLTGGSPGKSQIYAINWDGTGLKKITNVGSSSLTGATSPSVADDGIFVVYASGKVVAGNSDGNTEIWKNRTDVAAETQLTSTLGAGNFSPEISGGGGRIAFRADGPIGSLNPDGGGALIAMDGSGGTMRLLVEADDVWDYSPDLTADGSRAYFASTSNVFGTNPGRYEQLFRVQSDGTGLAQMTAIEGSAYLWHTATTSDGAWVVFVTDGDPLGQNASNSPQVFAIRGDGSELRQLTPESASSNGIGGQAAPAIAGNGSWVVVQSLADYTGGNANGGGELFRVRTDGTGLLQLTDDNDTFYKLPRVDGTGTWVVFQSGAGGLAVWRVRTDGSGIERLTEFSAQEPDVSDAGDRVVFISTADPLGTNADGNSEIFALEPAFGLLRQLTSTASGSNLRPRVSGDGVWVYFMSSAPFFGPNPEDHKDAYRVPATGGPVERVGAFGARFPGDSWRHAEYPVPNGDGSKAVFASRAEPADANPDGSSEVVFVDQSRVPALVVGAAAPTRVSWDAEPRPFRYDVIRGDVANLAAGSGGRVDLGPVVCVENDSIDLDTEETDDPDQPAPGQVFFYLNRGSEGTYAGPGSYGAGPSGGERLPTSGDCV